MSQGNNASREFVYTPRWSVMIAGVFFFGIAGFVIRAEAASNDRGLIINGVIDLSASSATTFYGVLSWLSFGFVAIAALMLIVRVLNPQKLVLAEKGLYAPKWAWSRTATFIAYRDVLAISAFKVRNHEFLKIVHSGGKQNVAASLLKSKSAFEEFCHELSRRIQTVGGTAAT
jgi:hypothetical protein